MKLKIAGWLGFLAVIVILGVGGFFLMSYLAKDTFEFKEVELLDYGDYTLQDFVEQEIDCDKGVCYFKNKDVIFTISEVKELGEQDISLYIKYEGEEFSKTFHVNVVDRKAPTIALSVEDLEIELNEDFDPASFIEEVTDNYDNLGIANITILNNVDNTQTGDYEVVYSIKDTSDNEGTAILKVLVKDKNNNSTTTSTDNKKAQNEESTLTWKYEISGLYSESGSLNQDNKKSSITKSIEVGWDSTFKITSTISSSEDIQISYVVSDKAITSGELKAIGAKYPIKETDTVNKSGTSSYEYTFDTEGTYYIAITVKSGDITLEKNIVLTLTSPEEVKDMRITYSKDNGTYLVLECEYIGGDDVLLFEVAITASDDDNYEDALVTENGEIRLYYETGHYYKLTGILVNKSGDILLAKTISIQK